MRFFYGKKANAANIIHGLAQLGGRSKKDGGGGMMKGVENIFKVGVEYGAQLALDNQQASSNIDVAAIFALEDENNKK